MFSNDQLSQTPTDGKLPYVPDIPALLAYVRGDDTSVCVTDPVRGGIFNFLTSSAGLTVDSGTVFAEAGGGFWVRSFNSQIEATWFGLTGDGIADDSAAFLRLVSTVTAHNARIVVPENYTINLASHTVNLPAGSTLYFAGGRIINGTITGNNSCIVGLVKMLYTDNLLFKGTFARGETVYTYETAADMKAGCHWPNKVCQTGGFWFKNDGGGAKYLINTVDYFNAENPLYFRPCWVDGHDAGIAGLYTAADNGNHLWAKLIDPGTEINAAVFGVKYDANYYDPAGTKFYTDSGMANTATDNHAALAGAIGQMQWWAINQLPKVLVLTSRLVIDKTLTLMHGAHTFRLRGNGYGDRIEITSNMPLNALIENIYDEARQNNLTSTFYVIEDLTFRGCGRVKNGLVVKNGYEVDGINRVQFMDFLNAGLVMYGASSTFKVDTISCFRNKYGLLITSTHPYRVTESGGSTPITNNVEGLLSLYKISGDHNTDSLIAIDCTSYGASINIQSVKSENNNLATVHILRSTPQQYISIKDAFTNGDGDFLVIENYTSSPDLPTIALEGIFHNDPDNDNYDINDLKSNRQIRFLKNPTASFPSIIYTSNHTNFTNGFLFYRNGIQIALDSLNTVVGKQYTASTDGSTTIITIPHGLTSITAASVVQGSAANAVSAGLQYASIDVTNIYLHYSSPPVAGTNNLLYNIFIKV